MTTLDVSYVQQLEKPFPTFMERFISWVHMHRISLAWITPVLALGGLIRLWNLSGTLGVQNDDGATYVAQAWAIMHGELAHYTYWYDHPPFGWMQIASWAWMTGAFDRYESSTFVGRELVGVYAVVSAGLVFVLCRKLGMTRFFGTLGAVLFLVSPLALSWAKVGFLDSMALPWVLAALVASCSRRHSGSSALWASTFLAGAILTKETFALFVPIVFWMIWQHTDRSRRLRNIFQSVTLMASLGMLYILMAVLKGELFPGKDRVSLVGSLIWQLGERQGSGSILDPSSTARYLVQYWLSYDQWLLLAAAFMLPLAFARRELRPISVALLLHVALPLRGGYLPAPYIIALLPIATVVTVGGLNAIWQPRRLFAATRHKTWRRSIAVALILVFGMSAGPAWINKTAITLTSDDFAPALQTVTWIKQNVPSEMGAQIIVDNEIWLDLVESGYERHKVDWFFKLDVDPEVMERYIPQGQTISQAWESIDYVVIPQLEESVIQSRPTMMRAIENADLVTRFGTAPEMNYLIYRVKHS